MNIKKIQKSKWKRTIFNTFCSTQSSTIGTMENCLHFRPSDYDVTEKYQNGNLVKQSLRYKGKEL